MKWKSFYSEKGAECSFIMSIPIEAVLDSGTSVHVDWTTKKGSPVHVVSDLYFSFIIKQYFRNAKFLG